jgi:hypothetical protein
MEVEEEDGRKVGAPLTSDREQWSVTADSGTVRD